MAAPPRAVRALEVLPDEILVLVCYRLRNSEHGVRALAKSLLISKRWHSIGFPVLYQDIALSLGNLRRFFTSFDYLSYGSLIQTFSLSVEAGGETVNLCGKPWFECTPEETTGLVDCVQSYNKTTRRRLRPLSSILCVCDGIRSFSFQMTGASQAGCSIRSSVLAGIVSALPLTCESIEIDGGSKDREPDEDHVLCHIIRKRLPYLRHLRISIAKLCPYAFSRKQWDEQVEVSSGTQLRAPSLLTMQVTCVRGFELGSGTTRLCGADPRRSAGSAVARHLWAMYEAGHFPSAQSIRVVEASYPEIRVGQPYGGHSTFVRFDILVGTTLVVPISNSLGLYSNIVIVRLPESDLAGDGIVVRDRIEGRPWVETTTGCHLPRELAMKDDRYVVRDGKPLSVPRTSTCSPSALLRGEDMTGTRLIESLLLRGFQEVQTLWETTPEGWIRNGRGHLSRIL